MEISGDCHPGGRTSMKNDRITPKLETELPLRIVLVAPPAGVDFGLQDGKGSAYKTIQKQRSRDADLSFEFTVTVKDNREDGLPNFLGPLAQGPTTGRFIYIDIGKSAGQFDSCWERRIKVPLGGISWDMIEKASADPKLILEARLPGTGKDGGPSCATVKPTEGWKVCRR
jgi:Family of unknown function (DUF5990)